MAANDIMVVAKMMAIVSRILRTMVPPTAGPSARSDVIATVGVEGAKNASAP